MRIFMDDGSTNIKMLWIDGDNTHTHISPNTFKRGWSADFSMGSNKTYNYTVDNEKYGRDLNSPSVLGTNNVSWQYSALNTLAIHHALHSSGIEPQDVEVVVTLPVSEFFDADSQFNMDNINRKKASVMRPVELNKGKQFTITKVTVRPESIPAGVSLCDNIEPSHMVLIVDLGGTTLDVSMVAGGTADISRVYGDSTLGVSLVTDAVKRALAAANTETSSHNVDMMIINRHNPDFLENHINDQSAIASVEDAINTSIERLRTRVVDVVNSFKGFSHVMVIGGGASLVADAIREAVQLRDDRFFVADNPQLALVRGLQLIG